MTCWRERLGLRAVCIVVALVAFEKLVGCILGSGGSFLKTRLPFLLVAVPEDGLVEDPLG